MKSVVAAILGALGLRGGAGALSLAVQPEDDLLLRSIRDVQARPANRLPMDLGYVASVSDPELAEVTLGHVERLRQVLVLARIATLRAFREVMRTEAISSRFVENFGNVIQVTPSDFTLSTLGGYDMTNIRRFMKYHALSMPGLEYQVIEIMNLRTIIKDQCILFIRCEKRIFGLFVERKLNRSASLFINWIDTVDRGLSLAQAEAGMVSAHAPNRFRVADMKLPSAFTGAWAQDVSNQQAVLDVTRNGLNLLLERALLQAPAPSKAGAPTDQPPQSQRAAFLRDAKTALERLIAPEAHELARALGVAADFEDAVTGRLCAVVAEPAIRLSQKIAEGADITPEIRESLRVTAAAVRGTLLEATRCRSETATQDADIIAKVMRDRLEELGHPSASEEEFRKALWLNQTSESPASTQDDGLLREMMALDDNEEWDIDRPAPSAAPAKG